MSNAEQKARHAERRERDAAERRKAARVERWARMRRDRESRDMMRRGVQS